MRFSEPFFLYLLIIAPVIYFISLGVGKKRIRELAGLGKTPNFEQVFQTKLSRQLQNGKSLHQYRFYAVHSFSFKAPGRNQA